MSESGTSRLEAFSDGVIAIAITLLILDVHTPEVGRNGDHTTLLHALLHQWTSYATYALTFIVIGIMWVNHHAVFARVRSAQRSLLFWNLLLLMGIAFLPFPTSVLARYVDAPHLADARTATVLYSLTMTYIGLAFAAVWVHLGRNPQLLADGVTVDATRVALRRSLVGPIGYAASALVGLAAPKATLVVYALLAFYFMASGRYVRAAG